VRELQPGYLGLITEPDTRSRFTGLRELEQLQKVIEVIRSLSAVWIDLALPCRSRRR
jgi:hypothetical protein